MALVSLGDEYEIECDDSCYSAAAAERGKK